MRFGFGVSATVPLEVLRELGGALFGLGYDDAWSNDLPGADGLACLAALGAGGPALRLGLGVAALDRRPPAELSATAHDHGLTTTGRFVLGVGAGFSESPRSLVRNGFQELHRLLPDDLRVGVAAMGPRMCRLAGEIADFVLLNWMTPRRIEWARERVAEGAQDAGRDPAAVEVAAYVRVAVGPGAGDRLAEEALRYASMPHYARHFEAMAPEGRDPTTMGVAAEDPAGTPAGLAPYGEVLDTLVVRGLPDRPTLEAHAAIAAAAR